MVDQSVVAIAEEYISMIPKNIKLKKAYLFGSFARGKEREGSDIDIALIIENMDDFFSMQRSLMRLRRNIDLRIEPHPIEERDFNNINPFAHEIQKYGMELSLREQTVNYTN